ncbi:copper chaperone PCu(A)C [Sphingomonas sp.]|uniref:copper chaperone PCu(A)C n=1 Tax=Sphingomonas sp. TaxID=28214 RepID=UPI0025CF197E|nr:copper chaperone PCu(A)C [Sphingomonas sp.]
MKRIFGLIACGVLVLGGCSKKPTLNVTDVSVRLPAVPRSPAAAYFTVTGGPVADRLIEVTSENAIRAELHESMAHGGMAAMKPITGGVAIPAKGTVKFESGGKHVMFFDVNPALKPPRTMPITFIFASGERIVVGAVLKRPGEQ